MDSPAGPVEPALGPPRSPTSLRSRDAEHERNRSGLERFERRGELRAQAGHLKPGVGFVLGVAQSLDAERVHRGARLGEVEPPPLDLREMGYHFGDGATFPASRLGEAGEQFSGANANDEPAIDA